MRLVDDIIAFNKDYIGEMMRNEVDMKVFDRIEKSLTGFQETLSKFGFTSTSLISQESHLHWFLLSSHALRVNCNLY